LALWAMLAPTSLAAAQEPDDAHALAIDTFAQRCISCHVPPDPAFAVDRAWLTQIADTA
jgi:mono/diheme cytochrome c family protein